MSSVLFEVVVIGLLLLLNGIFAMSELAVMTARRVRLEHMAEKGHRGANAALLLAHQPNDFLSTVQIGITLIGTLAGAFGGASPTAERVARLESLGGWRCTDRVPEEHLRRRPLSCRADGRPSDCVHAGGASGMNAC